MAEPKSKRDFLRKDLLITSILCLEEEDKSWSNLDLSNFLKKECNIIIAQRDLSSRVSYYVRKGYLEKAGKKGRYQLYHTRQKIEAPQDLPLDQPEKPLADIKSEAPISPKDISLSPDSAISYEDLGHAVHQHILFLTRLITKMENERADMNEEIRTLKKRISELTNNIKTLNERLIRQKDESYAAPKKTVKLGDIARFS
jgi:hypothetical protein